MLLALVALGIKQEYITPVASFLVMMDCYCLCDVLSIVPEMEQVVKARMLLKQG